MSSNRKATPGRNQYNQHWHPNAKGGSHEIGGKSIRNQQQYCKDFTTQSTATPRILSMGEEVHAGVFDDLLVRWASPEPSYQATLRRRPRELRNSLHGQLLPQWGRVCSISLRHSQDSQPRCSSATPSGEPHSGAHPVGLSVRSMEMSLINFTHPTVSRSVDVLSFK